MLFPTTKRENLKSKFFKYLINFFPAYRGSCGWMTFLSSDFKEAHVRLRLNFITRNYVGSIFGGSIYSSVDPIYMLMLMHILGDDFVVWDKAASIRFVRPARGKIRAHFVIDEETITQIKDSVAANNEIDWVFTVLYIDKQGKVCAEIGKTMYIAKRDHYLEKRRQKGHEVVYKKAI